MDLIGNLHEAEYRLIGSDPKNALPHFADAVELIQTWSEGGFFLVNQRIFPIKPGSVFLIDASKLHHSNPADPSRYNRSKVILSAEAWRRLLSFCGLESPFSQTFSRYGGAAWDLSPESEAALRIDRFFRDVVAAKEKKNDFSNLKGIGAVAGILSEIAPRPEENAYPQGEKSVHLMAKFINENVNGRKNVRMQDVADALHLSQSRAFHLFRRVTGKTLSRYLAEVKTEEAKVLLTTTQMRVREISETLGFRDPTVFCRYFKRDTGMTPLAYRSATAPKQKA